MMPLLAILLSGGLPGIMLEFGNLLPVQPTRLLLSASRVGGAHDRKPIPNRRFKMSRKTTILLSAVIVLGTAISASAATKSELNRGSGSAFYTMIPGYDKDGGVIALPDPDHYGQAQLAGDENPLRH
jgi:hypothetical protein